MVPHFQVLFPSGVVLVINLLHWGVLHSHFFVNEYRSQNVSFLWLLYRNVIVNLIQKSTVDRSHNRAFNCCNIYNWFAIFLINKFFVHFLSYKKSINNTLNYFKLIKVVVFFFIILTKKFHVAFQVVL